MAEALAGKVGEAGAVEAIAGKVSEARVAKAPVERSACQHMGDLMYQKEDICYSNHSRSGEGIGEELSDDAPSDGVPSDDAFSDDAPSDDGLGCAGIGETPEIVDASEARKGVAVDAARHGFPSRGAPWYAVQVVAGREDHMRDLIVQAARLEERAARERAREAREGLEGLPVAEEVFVPKARVGVKREGKWLPGKEPLMPGYLVAVTRHPDALARALRRVSGLARVVRQDNVFVPFSDQGVRWLEDQTQRGRRAVPMSEGYVEDGRLHVTQGPLKGREAVIVKVDHRKKVAYLEVEAEGRRIKAQLGIRITRKPECKKKRKQEQG